MLKQSAKQIERREKYRRIGQAISNLEREWRIARGESPNPWGVAKSGGFDVQQIITHPRLSKLERRTLEIEREAADVKASEKPT